MKTRYGNIAYPRAVSKRLRQAGGTGLPLNIEEFIVRNAFAKSIYDKVLFLLLSGHRRSIGLEDVGRVRVACRPSGIFLTCSVKVPAGKRGIMNEIFQVHMEKRFAKEIAYGVTWSILRDYMDFQPLPVAFQDAPEFEPFLSRETVFSRESFRVKGHEFHVSEEPAQTTFFGMGDSSQESGVSIVCHELGFALTVYTMWLEPYAYLLQSAVEGPRKNFGSTLDNKPQ